MGCLYWDAFGVGKVKPEPKGEFVESEDYRIRLFLDPPEKKIRVGRTHFDINVPPAVARPLLELGILEIPGHEGKPNLCVPLSHVDGTRVDHEKDGRTWTVFKGIRDVTVDDGFEADLSRGVDIHLPEDAGRSLRDCLQPAALQGLFIAVGLRAV